MSEKAFQPTCLYPPEKEIAKLVLGPASAKDWPALAVVLERKGLPPVDRMFGARYWPAVRAFLDRRNGLAAHDNNLGLDGN